MAQASAGKYRVAVLLGGNSSEREVSLRSGAAVAAAMRKGGHTVETIDPALTPLAAVDWKRFDVCFLALHGGEGEDGRIQQWLEDRGVAYTGSGPAASRAGMSKSTAKELFRRHSVPTPDFFLVDETEDLDATSRKVTQFGLPVILKPDHEGSSIGVGLVRNLADLPARLAESRRYDPLVVIERFIVGRELTVAVLDRQSLPVVEIVGKPDVFDYQSKYANDEIECRFDLDLPPMKVQEVQQVAVGAMAATGATGLARVDVMLDAQGRPWALEVNTVPGMTDHSVAPKAAAATGMDLSALCDWILSDALRRHGQCRP
jgi:D-alanine-D-alanine ligase